MQVQVTQTLNNSETPQLIRNLNKGDYFGEKALVRLVLNKWINFWNCKILLIRPRRRSSGFLNPAGLWSVVAVRKWPLINTFRYFLLTFVDNVIWPVWQTVLKRVERSRGARPLRLRLCSACLFFACLLLRSCELRKNLLGRKILCINMNVDEIVSTNLGKRHFRFQFRYLHRVRYVVVVRAVSALNR